MSEMLVSNRTLAEAISQIAGITSRPGGAASVTGLVARGAKAMFLARLTAQIKSPVCYVCAEEEPQGLLDDWRFFAGQIPRSNADGPSDIALLPPVDADPYRGTSPHPEVLAARALTLYRLAAGEIRALVIPVKSLLTRTVSRQEILGLGRTFRMGAEFPFERLERWLTEIGYVREDPVTAIGEFSIRGGLLDVFSPAHPAALRIEFFGDTIESIRSFDPETQRSVTLCTQATIVPLRELPFSAEGMHRWAAWARGHWSDPKFSRDLREKLEFADSGESFTGWEFCLPAVRPLEGSIHQYLSGPIWVLDEPVEMVGEVAHLSRRAQERFIQVEDVGQLALAPEEFFLKDDEVAHLLRGNSRIELHALGREAALLSLSAAEVDASLLPTTDPFSLAGVSAGDGKSARLGGLSSPLVHALVDSNIPEVEIPCRSVRRFRGHLSSFVDELNQYRGREYSILLTAHTKGTADRLNEMLKDYQISADPIGSTVSAASASTPGSIALAVGKLGAGFELPAARWVVFTETDVFEGEDWENRQPAPKGARRLNVSAFLSDFRDLKPGDFVVHVDHGIGKFDGLVQLETDGENPREYILLRFAEDTRLYVPVERLDLVQKYSAAEGATPALDRLGGVAWQKTKARTRKALRDMADELLKLYAARSLAAGFAFSPDAPWQAEFEDGFEFELTPDQHAAIGEVKLDMEKPVPMDRLLCGDVGYGKTEVAMRAAFKCVMDGKQVAVLVPTTVLAYQHSRTFEQRFAAFPIKIELVSRFRSAKEQKQTLGEAGDGAVDILIGTHRLLSRDVQFRDLGLVIVDEEQRFGVAHKERLKQLRRRVDVLTLSATPIPRTLNMSLMGLKPMSVIETPPRDRLAIQTMVAQFSHGLIQSALERELDRGGQIFFIHNRIDSIFTIAELLQRLVPRVRLGVAHAQMPTRELESVMLKFIRHEIDLLVSTTIIENGIDIPLANTIVVNHADRLGLSELYQLRGRVGRSNRRAYAYLLIPHESAITPVARRRLAAIREFSDLGAGFRLAALDLELRGAGNLLGGEQSGYINSVGFELYCHMLESAVRELRGEAVQEEFNTQIDLKIDIRIPEGYVPDMGQRLRLYKRVSSAGDDQKVAEIREDLIDRYGQPPISVENLMAYARLRREAVATRVLTIDRTKDVVHIKFDLQAPVDTQRLMALIQTETGFSFSPDRVLRYSSKLTEPRAITDELRTLLLHLRTTA